MRAPLLYLVCAALAVAAAHPTGDDDGQSFMDLETVNMAADPETINYILPKLAAKYRPNNEWRGVADPRFYVLTEMENNDIDNQDEDNEISESDTRNKRRSSKDEEKKPNLSINSTLDVLRYRMLLEIARKKAREGASRNRELLVNLGKRAFMTRRYSYPQI